VGEAKNQRASSISQTMAWAYSHPVRARALMILAARVASPREIAEELGEPLGTVSYHVRGLRDAGLIELVETDGSSGGVQHFYRAARLPIVDTETAVSQDLRTRAVASAVVINLTVSDVAAAVEAGRSTRCPSGCWCDTTPASTHGAGTNLYTNAMHRSIEIDEESRERLRESGAGSMAAGLHTLVFEMPSADEAPLDSTLEWVDGGGTPFPESGGSEGRRSDEADPPG
jgi:DNA-binding transcriptional ArsR family regulator